MRNISFASIMIAALVAHPAAQALEMSAKKQNTEIPAIGRRMALLEESTLAVINNFIDKQTTCAQQFMFYAPSSTTPTPDSNGCITNDPIPDNMIAAFHDTACPTGWSQYTAANGRVLVGYGSASGRTYSTIGGTTDTGGAGGAAYTTLTTSNLPSHNHSFSGTVNINYLQPTFWNGAKNGSAYLPVFNTWTTATGSGSFSGTTGNAGSSSAFDKRAPCTVVLWCRKN